MLTELYSFWKLQGRLCFLPLPTSRRCLPSLAHGSLPSSKPAIIYHSQLLLPRFLLTPLHSCLPPVKTLVMTAGPPYCIHDDLPISKHLIIFTMSFLPSKVVYSQVWGRFAYGQLNQHTVPGHGTFSPNTGKEFQRAFGNIQNHFGMS